MASDIDIQIARDDGRVACRENPPRVAGEDDQLVHFSRELGLNPYNFSSPQYNAWEDGYQGEAFKMWKEGAIK